MTDKFRLILKQIAEMYSKIKMRNDYATLEDVIAIYLSDTNDAKLASMLLDEKHWNETTKLVDADVNIKFYT